MDPVDPTAEAAYCAARGCEACGRGGRSCGSVVAAQAAEVGAEALEAVVRHCSISSNRNQTLSPPCCTCSGDRVLTAKSRRSDH